LEKDKAYLLHMREECAFLLSVGSNVPISEIVRDPVLQRAVVRSIEVLGEA